MYQHVVWRQMQGEVQSNSPFHLLSPPGFKFASFKDLAPKRGQLLMGWV